MFTIGNWILFGILLVIGLIVTVFIAADSYEILPTVISAIVTIVVVALVMVGVGWYNTHTASGARALKDYQSNLSNGIERTLKVIADDGYIIYEREGKFDVEVHDDYIVFDENHVRTILYRSLTSTLSIEEKSE